MSKEERLFLIQIHTAAQIRFVKTEIIVIKQLKLKNLNVMLVEKFTQ